LGRSQPSTKLSQNSAKGAPLELSRESFVFAWERPPARSALLTPSG
jgi:hypothetical protein